MKLSNHAKTLLISIAAPLLFVVAFIIVVASYSHFHTPPEVAVTSTGFAQKTISVPEGAAIHFVNRSATATQVICLGKNAHCEGASFISPMQAPPPRELLNPGLRLAPDQAKDIIFDTQGTFYVTNPQIPAMNLTVTVNATT